MSTTIKITDYNTVTPKDEDILLLNQGGENKNTTVQKLLESVNTKIGNIDVSSDGDVATQLNERMKDIFSITRNIDNKQLKLIGDSYMCGYGTSDYSLTGVTIYDDKKANTGIKCFAGMLKTYFENRFDCTVKNYGVGASKSMDIVANLSSLIEESDDIIICMIGINNRGTESNVNQLKLDLETIYNYTKEHNKEIIFMSHSGVSSTEDSGKFITTDGIDSIIMKFCSNKNIEYISLYKEMKKYLEFNSINLSSILNNDGLHPNDKGHDILYQLILSKLGFADRGSYDNIYDTGWIDLPLASGVITSDDFKAQYRRMGKYIKCRGGVSGVVSGLFATFPYGFRPSMTEIFLCGKPTNDVHYSKVAVAKEGTLLFKGSSETAASYSFFLSSIQFLID